MTRINAGIPPKLLTRQHLLAEHREMVRIPNAVYQGKADLSKPVPESFRMGAGHVRFFYDKLGYLFRRYRAVHRECVRRGYAVSDMRDAWKAVPKKEWRPRDRDAALVRARLRERDPDNYNKPLPLGRV